MGLLPGGGSALRFGLTRVCWYILLGFIGVSVFRAVHWGLGFRIQGYPLTVTITTGSNLGFTTIALGLTSSQDSYCEVD